ncbi:capsular polysaccharide biosynthesis protein [Desulfosarcina widdelii]|uniref:Capsular polysaccharide biosynthesis protein n=1 Tax=Desulfosarcina widdelii TaxID=947919 RepID=A0A5K7ZAA6_9BACT|nr:phenylacetate--CoA ligase family protein [Desulfosarcina widdelii]BBO77655.1 capsular polysaccharide biosynthesis protein [Desulfosarcina widdelii]
MSFSVEDQLYGNFKSIYNSSPQFIKSVIGHLYGLVPARLRYGKTYSYYLSLLEKSQWWSDAEIEDYQWRETERLLHHAYQNVPYYKSLFDEHALSLKDIQNFYDFKKIPYLTKEIVRNNLSNLLAKNYSKSNAILVTTGGSSGAPLSLYYEKGVSRSMENAFIMTQWKRYGYSSGDRTVVLRGDVIKNTNDKAPSYFDPIKNSLILSSYHMIDDNLRHYITKINSFKPKYLHVYPSSLIILAQYMKRNSVEPFPGLKGILASSETIHDWQLELFQEVFECRVYHWYGLSELAALAGVCEVSDNYHVFPEYSYVEFIKNEEEVINNGNDNVFEIVGTSFCNDITPLIRYRTMDYAIPEKNKCECGRNHKLIKKVLGRKQDFFIDKSGSIITFIYADVPLWPMKHKIMAYQYIQNVAGKVILKIEPKEKFTKSDIELIMSGFKNIYTRFELKIDFVEKIHRTQSGKFLYFKQNIFS